MLGDTAEVAVTRTRGAVFMGPRQPLSYESLLLDSPGPGEVAVRMVASGVCHSDLHVIDGEWHRPSGVVIGHEGAAIVEALGAGVRERPAGDPVDAGGLRDRRPRRARVDRAMRSLRSVPAR